MALIPYFYPHRMSAVRILSLIPYQVFPARMGGQKGIALFYQYLCRQLDLTVFTVQKNNTPQPYTLIPTISDGPMRYLNPLLFFRLRKLIAQYCITHLLFEHPYYAWLILLCKQFLRLPIIIHSHNIESERFRSIGKPWWKILWHYERLAYRQADLIWFKTREDLQYAVTHYGVYPQRCQVLPYGIEIESLPPSEAMQHAKTQLQTLYSIPEDALILLFNGILAYKPNLDALLAILDHINPLLLDASFTYRIIICGKNLPEEMQNLKPYRDKNIIYAGFVDDIDLYFKGCDIFLNPVQDGGGIKTKLVEALGFGKTCLSSHNGAIGVDAAITGGRLQIVDEKNWQGYCDATKHYHPATDDNQAFYKVFSWRNIATKAVESLNRQA